MKKEPLWEIFETQYNEITFRLEKYLSINSRDTI